MSEQRGIFLMMCWNGECVTGAAIDFGKPDDGELVLDALRQGRPAEYLQGEDARVEITTCKCSSKRHRT